MTSLFPWQENAWMQLQSQASRWPHALLFYGMEGIGKVAFAEALAKAALCESPLNQGGACGECSSCGWFSQGNHPDFRRIRPEIFEDEPVDNEEGGGDSKKAAKASKAPSKEIKIDQIRALSGFMNVSTHRQGQRVVVLYPAETLNGAAANALLKTLEEPPPATLFLLVTHRADRLLPTILSRCRQFPLPVPSRDEALQWLRTKDIADPENWLAQQGGAPLAALAYAQSEDREAMSLLLAHLSSPGVDTALRTAESLQKTPVPSLVASMQRWLHDLFSVKLSGTIRYHPSHRSSLTTLANQADTAALMKMIRQTNDRRRIADHPLSARLFIEDMLIEYASLFPRKRHG